ncbi:DUF6126 family protein [Streptomyces sp. NPDC059740]|uniref:DUF6126 family protein n=1 Tax=Streptomyces sp. NPDC059740 TaxID=3346926 RepID=UPI0036542FD8
MNDLSSHGLSEEPPGAAATPRGTAGRKSSDGSIPRGLWVRVVLYLVATHVLLGMLSLIVVMLRTR